MSYRLLTRNWLYIHCHATAIRPQVRAAQSFARIQRFRHLQSFF